MLDSYTKFIWHQHKTHRHELIQTFYHPLQVQLFPKKSTKSFILCLRGRSHIMSATEGGQGGESVNFRLFSDKGGGGVSQFLIFSYKGALSLNKHVE